MEQKNNVFGCFEVIVTNMELALKLSCSENHKRVVYRFSISLDTTKTFFYSQAPTCNEKEFYEVDFGEEQDLSNYVGASWTSGIRFKRL